MANRKILIIDDDLTALDIVDYVFEEQGFEVVRHADGVSALDSAQKINPDVILVDLMMPKMSGQECIKQLRSDGVSVPIIAFTAIDDADIHEEARKAGCDLVLTKPCRPKELVGKVNGLLG
jgi:two-component system alkaline phosphatase synthesis response regulator PhoP